MADTMTLSLVSPARMLAELEAKAAQIPGSDGEFTAMPDHAPFVSTLRPGMLRVTTASGAVTEYFVTGGFAEVSPTATAVLAEEAVERSAMRRDWLDEKLAEAEKAFEIAAEEDKIAAAQKVNDFKSAIELYGA
jgi:F-type H+-transporting ATPase subunit epsilon